MISKLRENKFYYISLLAIFVLGVLLRIHLFIANPSMHGDALSLVFNIENRNFWELFQPLSCNQVAPPLFLIIAKSFVAIFGEKDYIYRLPVIISAIASLIVFPIFASKFLKSKILIIITYMLFSINYMNIMYSVIFKQYSTESLFAMLSTILLISFYERFSENKTINNPKWLLLSILIGFFVWISYCSAIILIAGIAAMFVYSKKIKPFLPLIISISLNILLLIVMIFFSLKNYKFEEWVNDSPFFCFTIRDIALFFCTIFNYLKEEVLGFLDYYNHLLNLRDYLFLLLICTGLFSFKQKNYLFLVLPILLTWITSCFHLIAATGRTMIFILPFCYVLFVYKLDEFSQRIKIGISILIILSIIPMMNATFNHYLRQNIHFYNYTKEFLYGISKENPQVQIYTISDTISNFSPYFYNRTNFNSQLNIKELKDINTELITPCYIMKYDSFISTYNTANMLRRLYEKYNDNIELKYSTNYNRIYLLYLDKN